MVVLYILYKRSSIVSAIFIVRTTQKTGEVKNFVTIKSANHISMKSIICIFIFLQQKLSGLHLQ